MKTKFQGMVRSVAVVGALTFWPVAIRAQDVALSVGNTNPVRNAMGEVLPGTNDDPDNSCRVEMRKAWTGGMILAPSNDPAQIESFNPLVTNSYLGHGVLGSNPGTYAVTFTNRHVLDTDVLYYVRVFDRSTSASAIYYADTAPFYAPPVVPNCNPEFGALKRVDGTDPDPDADGDGIPDAIEGELGLDPNSSDTDEDGYPDWFEAHYDDYLNPKEGDAPLEIRIDAPEVPGVDPHKVSWWTIPVPGMTYRLGYRPQWTDGESFEEVWSGAATETLLEIDVEDVVTNVPVKGFFRVTVPYDGP